MSPDDRYEPRPEPQVSLRPPPWGALSAQPSGCASASVSSGGDHVSDGDRERERDRDRDNPAATQPPNNGARSRQVRWSVALFVLTFLSAMWSQLRVAPNETLRDILAMPLRDPARFAEGLPFAVTLMAILLAHEMGHYWVARRYGVDQSPPYFIPAPTLFGTFGAVILMRSRPANRRVLLHVAVMGPYAGLVLAVPAAAWGLAHSTPIDLRDVQSGLWFGSSLLFGFLETHFSPNGANVILHPVGLAGWVGLFVTSLNLIPAAQLDGGHIAYALFGRRQWWVSLVVVATLLAFGLSSCLIGEPGAGASSGGGMWVFWALLLFVIGLVHPPVRDESLRLTRADRLSGMVALLVFIVTFIPYPVQVIGSVSAGRSAGSHQRQPRQPPAVDEHGTPTDPGGGGGEEEDDEDKDEDELGGDERGNERRAPGGFDERDDEGGPGGDDQDQGGAGREYDL